MMQPIAHGGGLVAARRRFPEAPEPWIDLSTGINPVAYPVPSLPPEVFTRLPEPEDVTALEAAAARAYGVVDPAMVAAAPGTQSLIHLLPRLLPHLAPGRRIAILGPTYAEHAAAWKLAGAQVGMVGSLDTAGDAGVVVVCNPNNPDGRRHDPDALLAMADRLAAAGGLLVVDEAFADLEGCSLSQALPRPGLLLLRSLGKAYGLAGVRLGFALTDAPLAGVIRAAQGPWAVSGPALRVGAAALGDAAWRLAAATRLTDDAARLDMILQRAGCRVLGGTRLFRLVGHDDAPGAFGRLGRAGILVRRFDDHPEWLRFGIPPDDGWARLQTIAF
jgi:cobalamin biosynthetic protein CobC